MTGERTTSFKFVVYPEMKDWSVGTVLSHELQHLPNSALQTDEHRAAEDAVADVEFHEMRHVKKRWQIVAVQSVPGVDP